MPVLVSQAPALRSLCLSGCRSLTGEEVVQLAALPQLSALDLSDLQANTTSARAAVGPHPMQQVAALIGPRLISLTLSHNFVAGMQQILAALAVSGRRRGGECPGGTGGETAGRPEEL